MYLLRCADLSLHFFNAIAIDGGRQQISLANLRLTDQILSGIPSLVKREKEKVMVTEVSAGSEILFLHVMYNLDFFAWTLLLPA